MRDGPGSQCPQLQPHVPQTPPASLRHAHQDTAALPLGVMAEQFTHGAQGEMNVAPGYQTGWGGHAIDSLGQ